MSTPMPRARAHHPLVTLVLLCLLTLLSACSDPPEARYEQLKSAIEEEEFERFTSFFTLASNAELRTTLANGTRSKIKYITDWKGLVPVGEVTAIDIRGQVAFLTIGEGKKKQEIRMLLEHDKWCVDLAGLSAYWEPLKGGK